MNIEKIQKKSGIVGRSESIKQVLEMVAQVAPVDISVLIAGESGTGKELFAKAVAIECSLPPPPIRSIFIVNNLNYNMN